MSVLVTDKGFAQDDWNGGVVPLAEAGDGSGGVEIDVDADPSDYAGRLDGVELVRIPFASFADGRGITIGRRLRLMGYSGRLRAAGHVLADQYAMIRRAGFDEVEISDDLAKRQPEEQWQRRSDWRAHDYQARLRGQTG